MTVRNTTNESKAFFSDSSRWILRLVLEPQPRGAGGEGRSFGDDLQRHRRSLERVRASRAKAAWARLIRKVYESDPLECPKCKGPMTACSQCR